MILNSRAERAAARTAQNIASILTAYAQIGKDPGEHLLAELMTRAEFLAAQMSPEQAVASARSLARARTNARARVKVQLDALCCVLLPLALGPLRRGRSGVAQGMCGRTYRCRGSDRDPQS